jgi:hypothetical protein
MYARCRLRFPSIVICDIGRVDGRRRSRQFSAWSRSCHTWNQRAAGIPPMDREINGKLYYPLWILFMGGFVLSIGYTNQPDLFSNCWIRLLLRVFRLSAIGGSVLNFWFQSRAIDTGATLAHFRSKWTSTRH